MAKSRKALRLMLTSLNLSKESRGFISDYDLFTTHSKMGPELFDEPLKRGWTDELNWDLDTGCESTARPNPKKRKLNSNSSPQKRSGNMWEPDQQEEMSQPNTATKNKTSKIDYRTVSANLSWHNAANHLNRGLPPLCQPEYCVLNKENGTRTTFWMIWSRSSGCCCGVLLSTETPVLATTELSSTQRRKPWIY